MQCGHDDSLILIAHITYITTITYLLQLFYIILCFIWVSVFVSHKPNTMSGHEIVWARLQRYTYMRWPIMGKFFPGCGWVEDWNYISRSLRKHAMASPFLCIVQSFIFKHSLRVYISLPSRYSILQNYFVPIF